MVLPVLEEYVLVVKVKVVLLETVAAAVDAQISIMILIIAAHAAMSVDREQMGFRNLVAMVLARIFLPINIIAVVVITLARKIHWVQAWKIAVVALA